MQARAQHAVLGSMQQEGSAGLGPGTEMRSSCSLLHHIPVEATAAFTASPNAAATCSCPPQNYRQRSAATPDLQLIPLFCILLQLGLHAVVPSLQDVVLALQLQLPRIPLIPNLPASST